MFSKTKACLSCNCSSVISHTLFSSCKLTGKHSLVCLAPVSSPAEVYGFVTGTWLNNNHSTVLKQRTEWQLSITSQWLQDILHTHTQVSSHRHRQTHTCFLFQKHLTLTVAPCMICLLLFLVNLCCLSPQNEVVGSCGCCSGSGECR